MGETLMHLVKLDRVRVEASVDPKKYLLRTSTAERSR